MQNIDSRITKTIRPLSDYTKKQGRSDYFRGAKRKGEIWGNELAKLQFEAGRHGNKKSKKIANFSQVTTHESVLQLPTG
jgi:hypothetical protein